jgi:hypothetical protein
MTLRSWSTPYFSLEKGRLRICAYTRCTGFILWAFKQNFHLVPPYLETRACSRLQELTICPAQRKYFRNVTDFNEKTAVDKKAEREIWKSWMFSEMLEASHAS